jgi:hypothetical protein
MYINLIKGNSGEDNNLYELAVFLGVDQKLPGLRYF